MISCNDWDHAFRLSENLDTLLLAIALEARSNIQHIIRCTIYHACPCHTIANIFLQKWGTSIKHLTWLYKIYKIHNFACIWWFEQNKSILKSVKYNKTFLTSLDPNRSAIATHCGEIDNYCYVFFSGNICSTTSRVPGVVRAFFLF